MPTMEGYENADVPHEKTVMHDGYLYGCHTTKPDDPRGRTVEHDGHDGYFNASGDADYPHTRTPRIVKIVTEWIPKRCGHNFRITDPCCTGCTNRTDD